MFTKRFLVAPWILTLGAACAAMAPVRGQAPAPALKLAFYNIKSGFGQVALPGITRTFSEGSNCQDKTHPLNAWGAGVVQAELQRLARDPGVISLGLAEAWTCATPAGVQTALGWKGVSSERNGVALVARYGFGGPEEWVQLDTSGNPNPKDTMWVLRVPVCLDAQCGSKLAVFTAHWYSNAQPDAEMIAVYEKQAHQTLDFMQALPAAEPRVLLGDLNVFTGTQPVCRQTPRNSPIRILADAGYVDAWAVTNPGDPGYTGMWNRAGCGVPEGGLWKRIDYAWSRGLRPLSMTRFGMVDPGHEAPSDHAGIVVQYAAP